MSTKGKQRFLCVFFFFFICLNQSSHQFRAALVTAATSSNWIVTGMFWVQERKCAMGGKRAIAGCPCSSPTTSSLEVVAAVHEGGGLLLILGDNCSCPKE